LGHAFGDELLVAVAGRLHDSLRAGDTAARFGGDEFVIMLDEIENSAAAVQITERIVLDLQRPFMLSGREVFITPSIGIALSGGQAASESESGSASSTRSADDLLRDADAAMYEAKRRGKARHEIFHVNLGAGAMLRLELGNDLQRAIERHELVLHFQPQVELSSGLMSGVEALVRWQHPRRGLLSPAEFIPLAEESGLIIPIGQWVLREACLQACRWQREHPHAEPIEMGVNLSVKQLHQIGLVDDIALVLRETGLDPKLLVLEITESVIIEEADHALSTLHALKELGVRLAIDDFGTGYSSLAYLKSLPMDILKIDRKFVAGLDNGLDGSSSGLLALQNGSLNGDAYNSLHGLGHDGAPARHGHGRKASGDLVIVSSMIDLAHGLGLQTLAEGVETLGEVAQLRLLGSQLAQGFHFARPVPADEISQLIQHGFPLQP
jgi:diguanylate cyclase (GGDEF)-like protein